MRRFVGPLVATLMLFTLSSGASGTEASAAPESVEPLPAAAEGTGTAVVGDTTWAFALSEDPRSICNPDFSGFFVAVMFGQDDEGNELVLSVQGDPASGTAAVQAGDPFIPGELWISDANAYADASDLGLPPGIGATIEVNGNRATGTAVFYEDRALQEARQTGAAYSAGIVEGTFDVACPTD